MGTYRKVVKKRLSRLNSTLRNLRRSIHMIGTIHKQSMEMQRRALIAQVIPGIDQNGISNISLNHGDWPHPIYANRGPLEGPIRIRPDPFNSEIIRHRRSQNGRRKNHGPSKPHLVV